MSISVQIFFWPTKCWQNSIYEQKLVSWHSVLQTQALDDGDLMDFTWKTQSLERRQMVLNKHVDFFRFFKSPQQLPFQENNAPKNLCTVGGPLFILDV